LLSACSGFTVEPAQTFNERVDYAATAIDAVIQSAATQRQAGALNPVEATRIHNLAAKMLDGLDRARELYALSVSTRCQHPLDANTAMACHNQHDAALSALENAQSLLLQLQHQLKPDNSP